jgi:proteasome lid subunit RPN8/RPN11
VSSPLSASKYSRKRTYEHLLDAHKISRQRETLFLVILDVAGSPKFSLKLATGTEGSLDVDGAQDLILRVARGRPFVVAHTHPSGSTIPSQADRDWTRKFRQRAGAQFVDHLVVTEWGCGSV